MPKMQIQLGAPWNLTILLHNLLSMSICWKTDKFLSAYWQYSVVIQQDWYVHSLDTAYFIPHPKFTAYFRESHWQTIHAMLSYPCLSYNTNSIILLCIIHTKANPPNFLKTKSAVPPLAKGDRGIWKFAMLEKYCTKIKPKSYNTKNYPINDENQWTKTTQTKFTADWPFAMPIATLWTDWWKVNPNLA